MAINAINLVATKSLLERNRPDLSARFVNNAAVISSLIPGTLGLMVPFIVNQQVPRPQKPPPGEEPNEGDDRSKLLARLEALAADSGRNGSSGGNGRPSESGNTSSGATSGETSSNTSTSETSESDSSITLAEAVVEIWREVRDTQSQVDSLTTDVRDVKTSVEEIKLAIEAMSNAIQRGVKQESDV